ncbi:MAG: thermonuclease family protein [Planctomycetota bacterium]
MDRRWIATTGMLVLAIALGVALGRWTAPGPADANAARPVAVSTPIVDTPATREITASDFEVVRVIDGDTFKIHYDGDLTSVRMLHINAPERGDPRADDATEALRQLIDGQTVQLHFDAARRRDNFGRLLCRVTVDGLDVGQHLLDAGLVSVYQPGPRRSNAER